MTAETPPSVVVREATAADLESITAIERSSFPDDPWSQTMLAETLASVDSPVWVAEQPVPVSDRAAALAAAAIAADAAPVAAAPAQAASPSAAEVIGFAAVLAPQGASDADVLTIAVAAAARGLGLGRRLLVRLAATARTRGAHQLFLEVRSGNAVARGLYESEGFTVIGTRPRYYQPDGEDATVMRLDLHHWSENEPTDGASHD